MHRLRPIAVVAILAFAALLRLWALGRPDSLVFDELYYVRDAVSQLAHGVPTTWPDNDPAFGGERAFAFTDVASSVAHPPLGKWLIGLGLLLLGPDTGWGWRLSVALAGVATVGVTMRLGFLLSRTMWVACLAGLLLAVDGVHVVLSRVSLLDGLLTLFVALGALFVLHDWLHTRSESPVTIRWRRPWLLLAAASFGAAAAIKWSGLYALAAFLLLVTVAYLLRRFGAKDARPMLHGALQGLTTAAIALPVALATYLASWTGWIMHHLADPTESKPWWHALWEWHTQMFSWHASLDAQHPYQAHPLTWPLALRPTAMFFERDGARVAIVSPMPNPLVTWGAVASLLLLMWVVLRAARIALRDRSLQSFRARSVWVSAFVLTGYLSGLLPWLLTFSRSAMFQFYSVVMTPFASLALALVLVSLASIRTAWVCAAAGIAPAKSSPALRSRRIAVGIVVVATVLVGLWFWPVWSALPVPEWFYRAHLWLPGW